MSISDWLCQKMQRISNPTVTHQFKRLEELIDQSRQELGHALDCWSRWIRFKDNLTLGVLFHTSTSSVLNGKDRPESLIECLEIMGDWETVCLVAAGSFCVLLEIADGMVNKLTFHRSHANPFQFQNKRDKLHIHAVPKEKALQANNWTSKQTATWPYMNLASLQHLFKSINSSVHRLDIHLPFTLKHRRYHHYQPPPIPLIWSSVPCSPLLPYQLTRPVLSLHPHGQSSRRLHYG